MSRTNVHVAVLYIVIANIVLERETDRVAAEVVAVKHRVLGSRLRKSLWNALQRSEGGRRGAGT